MRIAVLCPHFHPDVAPTGEVMTSIVEGLAELGHQLHVVTALPWYRRHAVEPGWEGRLVRRRGAAMGAHRADPSLSDREERTSRPAPSGSSGSPRWRRWRPRWRARPAGRARDVTTADARVGRMGRRAAPRGAVRVQHPGRLPRRRRGARVAQGEACCPGRGMARTVHLSPGRCRDGAERRSGGERAGEADRAPPRSARRSGQGARDPELRRHRLDQARPEGERLPERARSRGEADRDVRRQRRPLAVPRSAPGCGRGDR